MDGVERFKDEGYELIIVDTSGRHKQESALFAEMEQMQELLDPQDIIFVMDSAIGQAAHDQALAFKQKVRVGSVIITKLDGHAKGGGAISAVSATESPITFIGTGEHIDELEEFNAASFVGRLLGLGDVSGLVNSIKSAGLADNPEMVKRLTEGVFTLRDLGQQFQSLEKLGPINKVMGMVCAGHNWNLLRPLAAMGFVLWLIAFSFYCTSYYLSCRFLVCQRWRVRWERMVKKER